EPYQVRIDLDETGVVDTGCSCPYDHGGICKHRVAVLLAYNRDPDETEQCPPASELIADADPEDLREVLIDRGESHPTIPEQIESRLGSEEPGDTWDHTPDANQDSMRQQVRYILRSSEGRNAHVHNPYAAVETDVEQLRDLREEAWTAIEAGDGRTAIDILEPLADELMDEEWLALSYDDSHAIFEFLDDIDTALAEALLMADLSGPERADWENRLWTWEQAMGGYTHQSP